MPHYDELTYLSQLHKYRREVIEEHQEHLIVIDEKIQRILERLELVQDTEESEMKSCKGKMKDKMPEPKDGMKEGKDEGGNKMKRTKKKGMK